MTMYVYSTTGEPVGFVFGEDIFDLGGQPLARIHGNRVHSFDGEYKGEWFRDMVVHRPDAQPRRAPAVAAPQPRSPPPASCRLRAVVNYGYDDAFEFLGKPADQDRFRQAAEG